MTALCDNSRMPKRPTSCELRNWPNDMAAAATPKATVK